MTNSDKPLDYITKLRLERNPVASPLRLHCSLCLQNPNPKPPSRGDQRPYMPVTFADARILPSSALLNADREVFAGSSTLSTLSA